MTLLQLPHYVETNHLQKLQPIRRNYNPSEKTQSTVLIEEKEKKQNPTADGKRAAKTQTGQKNPNKQQNPKTLPLKHRAARFLQKPSQTRLQTGRSRE
jgi:hypothetical protein